MSYIGQSPGQGQAERFIFTATGGETSVTLDDAGRGIAYTVGQVDVYLNGVKLVNGTDFTATSGSSITGLSALVASDIVEIVALDAFSPADTVSASNGGTFSGNVTHSGTLTATSTTSLDGAVVINESGADVDFRIESDTNANAFFLNGANGYVGIGTNNPSHSLETVNSTFAYNRTRSTNGAYTGFDVGQHQSGQAVLNLRDSNFMQFLTNDTERMRIDSSGSLLVGKTAADSIGTDGIEIDGPNGRVIITRDGNEPLILNRKTSDGDIAIFRKDGTTVGSIGSSGGQAYIGGTTKGIRFSTLGFTGTDNTGALSDGAIDIGTSSHRIKDLYLSGGVYLGGTGAANYLDDYEAGTWTPTATAGSLSYTGATYVKIGSAVHVSGSVSGFTDTSGTALEINGLPFTSSSGQRSVGSVFFRYVNHSHDQLSFYTGGSSSQMQLWSSNKDGAYQQVSYSQLQSGHTIFFQLTYYTDA